MYPSLLLLYACFTDASRMQVRALLGTLVQLGVQPNLVTMNHMLESLQHAKELDKRSSSTSSNDKHATAADGDAAAAAAAAAGGGGGGAAAAAAKRSSSRGSGTQFTCFTGTKVPILTRKALQARRQWRMLWWR
jgi:hypothetical protein